MNQTDREELNSLTKKIIIVVAITAIWMLILIIQKANS